MRSAPSVSHPAVVLSPKDDWLVRKGEMGGALARFPWQATPMGPRSDWPQSLRTTVNMMLEAGVASIFCYGPDHRLLYNDACRDLLQDKHPAALGRPAGEVFPEVWHQLRPLFGRAYGGQFVTFEDTALNLVRNGRAETAFFSGSFHPVRNETGAVIGFLALLVETTGRIHNERERAQVFETALSAITDFAFTCDREARLRYANQPLLDLWGLPLAKAVGKSLPELKFAPDLASRLQRQIRQVFETKRILRDEMPYTSPAGASGHYEYILSPVFEADGTVSTVAGSARDISARKNLEIQLQQTVEELRTAKAQLEEQASALEKQVSERTAELRATIADLESFSYSVSHDLRSPLRAMQCFAEAMREDCGGELSPTAQDYLHRIASAAHRMDLIIQDVLVYSRITRAELPLDPIPLEVFIRSLLDDLPSLQAVRNAITIEGPLPVVLANLAGLTQCVANLLGNAVKFVAPGVAPRVTISCALSRGRAHVSIRDNGIGIPAEAHETIFGLFYRLDHNYEGTGIGLAIVRKAVERMGGSIKVESAPGQGSTFTFDLALAGAP